MRRAVIFTAKSTETPAVEKQLIGPIKDRKVTSVGVYNVYHLRANISKKRTVRDFEIALYETGRGQDEVMRVVHSIVSDFKPDVVLYLGCAGGEASELQVNDVLVATEAWPYEKGKETAKGFISRAHPQEPTKLMTDYAKSVAKRLTWRKRIPPDYVPETAGVSRKTEVKFGALASGNKVLTTEQGRSWLRAKRKLSDEIVGVETEAYAFYKAMADAGRPYLMIRGISDNLANKNASGKNTDDLRQTRATGHAAAFAAELLDQIDYEKLQKARGVSTSRLQEHVSFGGFWSSKWVYGDQRCKDLIELDIDDSNGHISGSRMSLTPPHQLKYRLSGQVYGDCLFLSAILEGRARPIMASFLLQAENHFREALIGIATRPLGRKPRPKLARSVVDQNRTFWASPVTYKRVDNPARECPDLWSAFKAP